MLHFLLLHTLASSCPLSHKGLCLKVSTFLHDLINVPSNNYFISPQGAFTYLCSYIIITRFKAIIDLIWQNLMAATTQENDQVSMVIAHIICW
jgi:hypothetical protein